MAVHGYTCGYCVGDDRPRWETKDAFDEHMQSAHSGLPNEPLDPADLPEVSQEDAEKLVDEPVPEPPKEPIEQ